MRIAVCTTFIREYLNLSGGYATRGETSLFRRRTRKVCRQRFKSRGRRRHPLCRFYDACGIRTSFHRAKASPRLPILVKLRLARSIVKTRLFRSIARNCRAVPRTGTMSRRSDCNKLLKFRTRQPHLVGDFSTATVQPPPAARSAIYPKYTPGRQSSPPTLSRLLLRVNRVVSHIFIFPFPVFPRFSIACSFPSDVARSSHFASRSSILFSSRLLFFYRGQDVTFTAFSATPTRASKVRRKAGLVNSRDGRVDPCGY